MELRDVYRKQIELTVKRGDWLGRQIYAIADGWCAVNQMGGGPEEVELMGPRGECMTAIEAIKQGVLVRDGEPGMGSYKRPRRDIGHVGYLCCLSPFDEHGGLLVGLSDAEIKAKLPPPKSQPANPDDRYLEPPSVGGPEVLEPKR
ncbi:MAG: hypothetical protein ACKVP7_13970 [Hyphomicrobiaceae bacterium]